MILIGISTYGKDGEAYNAVPADDVQLCIPATRGYGTLTLRTRRTRLLCPSQVEP